jgi:acyl-CoA-dependent ceramide synthase
VCLIHGLIASAFQILIIPIVLYMNWEALAPWVAPGLSNPFASFIFISYPIAGSSGDDPRYAKGYLDVVFIAYHIVFFSFIRQFITIKICRPIAKYFGIKKKAKIDRFGEQGYAMIYFTVFGAWGWVCHILSPPPPLPDVPFVTENNVTIANLVVPYRILLDRSGHPALRRQSFSCHLGRLDYPHWQMVPELKRYYIMQISYWCQQLIVLLLGLEKPRKDHLELVAHHIVTLWLVG